MRTVLASALASSLALFAVGLAAAWSRIRAAGRSPKASMPLIACAAWALLEGAAFVARPRGGRRLDLAFAVEHYALFLVPLAAAAGALVGSLSRYGSRLAARPRTLAGAALGAAAGLASLAAARGGSYIDWARSVFLAWDTASYAILAAAAYACARWVRGGGRPGALAGRLAASVALLGLLLLDLAPRCRIVTAEFFPWPALALGAWGLYSIALSTNPARGGAKAIGRGAGVDETAGARGSASVPGPDLSPRELEVALAAAEGLRNTEIAAKLNISLATVKKHLANAMEKADCRNRVELSAAIADRIILSATVEGGREGRSSGHGGSDDR